MISTALIRSARLRRSSRARCSAVQPFVAHPDPWAIVVHCTAGISRSAAVAFWLQNRFAIHDHDEFAALHAHCRPNRTLLRLLGATVPE